MEIDEILKLSNMAKESGQKFKKKRFFMNYLNTIMEKDRFIGIVGPRGVGKTVILKQLLKKVEDSFYISLDTYTDKNLFDVIINLHRRFKVNLFLLDEVHFYLDFSSLLKKLYDFTNEIRIIFTSSVSLIFSVLNKDLSRRIKLSNLYPFDFKEYLFFTKDINLPYLSFKDIVDGNWGKEYLGFNDDFKNYILGELYPFSMEVSNIIDNLKNVLDRVIKEDIASIHTLSLRDLQDITDLLSFIGKSPIDGINYSSLSQNIGITKYKAKQYVEILEKAFILNYIMPTGTNIKKESKIVMTLPFRLLYSNYNDAIGGLREDFAVQILKMKGLEFNYLKSNRGEKRPDYLVKKGNDRFIIEIGGKNKGYKQFKGIDSKKFRKVIFSQNSDLKRNIPLYLLGFLK
ncbi:ATP-binding protein [Candidatus Dependentiae bacterium]|nr:ATP-binding protein [Candidatus Dependentiae bacterium]